MKVYGPTGSKFRDMTIVTLTKTMANSEYVPTDERFGRYTFQVWSSAVKPGGAETPKQELSRLSTT